MLAYIQSELIKKYGKGTSNYKTAISTARAFLNQNQHIKSLDQCDDIMNAILNSSKSLETKRKQLFIFAYIYETKKDKKCQKKMLKVYSRIKYQILNQRKENKVRNRKEAECLMVTLTELRKRIKWNVFDQQNMVFNIFVSPDQTPRLEIRTLVLETKDKKKGNYIIEDKKRKGFYYMMLNSYKTSQFYGPWKIRFNDKMSSFVRNYIKKNGIKPGNHFFLNQKKKEYPSNKFSEYVQRIFKKRVGVNININCLRKIKEIELFHNNKISLNMSLKEKEEWVKKNFRHNLHTSLIYYNKIGIRSSQKKFESSEKEWKEKEKGKRKGKSKPGFEIDVVKLGKKGKKGKRCKKKQSAKLVSFLGRLKNNMRRYDISSSKLKTIASSITC